ncbi:hypothetical protein ANTRET_LOCUS6909 [Anthophora retusa]
MLAITGDGSFRHHDFKKKWDWVVDLSKMTAIQAIQSVYNVNSLDDIGSSRSQRISLGHYICKVVRVLCY